MYRFLLGFILLFTSQGLFSQSELWQTAIYASDEWNYVTGSALIPNDWREIGFDDNDWETGAGSIGYGDNDDATIIDQVFSLYMRKSFALSDKNKIIGCLFNADYDDAFVAYLNGVEIVRANIVGEFPAWNENAVDYREAEMYQGGDAINYFIDDGLLENILVDGENVLAVQTHNRDGFSSSDLTTLYWLSFLATEPLEELGEFHFEGFQSGETTPLPIVRINTFGAPILDEPKIDGEIDIVWNGDGNLNDFDASANEYEGRIRIEKKGQSSLALFPKHSYLFEMIDEEGNDLDTSFLNFPTEEDFILHGPYSDKSLLRNVLIFDLANKLDQYATRTRFVELEVNGFYEGIYVMMERIKRDKNRVDIAKLKEDDLIGDELTGGYIFKIDKGQADWYSQYDMENNPGAKLHFQYVYPRRANIMPEQENYIQSYIDSFERAMVNPNFAPDGKYYHEFIDIESFVDHFLLVELAKDVDGYRFSSYMHKDKESNGGKLKCGPLWDFNIAFGNGDYCNGWDATGFMYNLHCDRGNPFWWKQLFNEPDFRNHAQCRWQELRQTVFDRENIYKFIDEQVALLNPAIERNYERWPVLGQYVWPNFYVPSSYSGEINVLKDFIGARLEWMDNHMIGACDSTYVFNPAGEMDYSIAPNPADASIDLLFVEGVVGEVEIRIYNEIGKEVLGTTDLINYNTIHVPIAYLEPGLYFIQIYIEGDEGPSINKLIVY